MSVYTASDGHVRFHCHACGASGDTYDLASRLRSMGVLPAAPSSSPALAPSGLLIPDAMYSAFCQTLLPVSSESPATRQTRNYLWVRGVTSGTCDALDIRVAPYDHPDQAVKHARVADEHRLSWLALAAEANLCRFDYSNGYVGRWRNHAVVTVRDPDGSVSFLSARRAAQVPNDLRYWTLRPHPDAARLWPLHGEGVADAIQTNESVILVPGFVEAARLWQVGVQNVLATFGDRILGDEDLQVLVQVGAKRIVLAYHLDQEPGGRLKAEKAAARLRKLWVGPVLVEGFREQDDGPTVDADELLDGRLLQEAHRLLDRVRQTDACRPTEGALVFAESLAMRDLPRGSRPLLASAIEDERKARLATGRGLLTTALPSIRAPGTSRAHTFPIPIDLRVSATGRDAPPFGGLTALQRLLYLWFWSAQAALWAKGISAANATVTARKFGVRVKQTTLAKRLGVTDATIGSALRVLLARGLLVRFRGKVPGIDELLGPPAAGCRKRDTPPKPPIYRYVAVAPRIERPPDPLW